MSITVTWFDHQREPQCAPDPAYPDGRDIDLRRGSARRNCIAELPYPAPRCGAYFVACDKCGFSVVITTAGRPDDPRKVFLPCKPN
jgi:hypothetical protein